MISAFRQAPRERFQRQLDSTFGRHDEARFYSGHPGDPGLCGGPTSLSWELHASLPTVLLAGGAALVMEVLHPSVMHGVATQSSYRTEPERRARATLGYVLRTTFGHTAAATQLIEHVREMHGRVQGVRPDGVAYRALDPDLIAWVHTSIPWAVMSVYEQTVRPLSRAEKDQYLREQARIGRMGGATSVPESVDALASYVEAMRPQLAMNEQTVEFLGFVMGRIGPPRSLHERIELSTVVLGGMTLMPEWARRMTGTYRSPVVGAAYARVNALRASIVRRLYPAPRCVALAHARVGAR
ncbi:MAG: oxygenase MpaB family protein [Myxococcota bacterium]